MPSLGRVVFLNVLYTLLSSGAIGLGMFSAELFFFKWLWPLILMAGSIMYVELIRHLRQRRVLPCFLVAYVLVILVWPWLPSRFDPDSAVSTGVSPQQGRSWLQKLSMLACPIFFGLTGVSMLLIMNFVLLYQAVTISQSMHYPYLARLEKPISWSSYEGIFQWIKANTQPTDVLASGLDTTIYLYTQRRTIRPFVGLTGLSVLW